MCQNPTFLPDENQYEPCMECAECNPLMPYDYEAAYQHDGGLDQAKHIAIMQELANEPIMDIDDLPF